MLAFSVAIDPLGQYAYVANRDAPSLSQYAIGVGGALAPLTPATVATGRLPNDVAVDPSGKYVYVPNSLDDNLSLYTIGAGGALAPQTPATVGAGSSTRNIVTTGAYQ